MGCLWNHRRVLKSDLLRLQAQIGKVCLALVTSCYEEWDVIKLGCYFSQHFLRAWAKILGTSTWRPNLEKNAKLHRTFKQIFEKCSCLRANRTSLLGNIASLPLFTLSVRVNAVCPFGLDFARLYLFSSDVKLLLSSSSEEEASAYEEKVGLLCQTVIRFFPLRLICITTRPPKEEWSIWFPEWQKQLT